MGVPAGPLALLDCFGWPTLQQQLHSKPVVYIFSMEHAHMNKFTRWALAAVLALPLAASAQVGIGIRIGPPAPVVETPPPPPYAGAVWIGGYHRWDGNRYVWVPGRYERPPHPGARWVAGRWEHRGDGYHWREGRWR